MLEAFVIRSGIGWRAGVAGRHAGQTVRQGFTFEWGQVPTTNALARQLARRVKIDTGVVIPPATIKRLATAKAFRLTLAHGARG